MSEWSDWTPCENTNQQRTRNITKKAQFGGKACQNSTQEIRGCGPYLWRWKKTSVNSLITEIPYAFDDLDLFEDSYKTRITNAINYLNSEDMLGGCIHFR